MWQQWSADLLPALVDMAVKGSIVFALAGLLVLSMRRTSAAQAQAVWLAGMVCLLVLPVLSAVLPGWQVLPEWCTLSVEKGGVPPADAPSPEIHDLGTNAVALRPVPPPNSAGPVSADPVAPVITSPTATAEASSSYDSTGTGPDRTRQEVGVEGDQPSLRRAADGGVSATVAPPAEAAIVSAARGHSFLAGFPPWIVGIWGFGAVLVLATVLLAWLVLWWTGRKAKQITDGPDLELLKQTASELGMRRRVRLIVSDRCSIPLAVGILRPRVIVPTVFPSWPADRRKAVMLHELGHIMRWDCLAKIVAHVVCASTGSTHWYGSC